MRGGIAWLFLIAIIVMPLILFQAWMQYDAMKIELVAPTPTPDANYRLNLFG